MNGLHGFGTMVRLVLRRDRVALPVWIVVLAGFVNAAASTFSTSYPTPADRAEFADGIRGNPAMAAIYGPLFDDSVGGLTSWRVGVAGALLFGVFSILTVVKHTRREEESGRTELLRSGVVGRHAPLAAALTVTLGTHLLVALLIAAGLAGQGLPVAGAIALAATLGGIGAVLAGVAAVTAQLSTTARGATLSAIVVFALMVLLRTAGDTAGADGTTSWLLWLTPLGWAEHIRPFAGDHWWVIGLIAVLVLALSAAAFAVSGRRDLGSGVFHDRPGPAKAGRRLQGPLALAWRLHRGTLAAAVAGCLIVGLLMGTVADSVGHVVGSSAGFAEMLDRLHAANAGDALMQLLIYALAEVVTAYAILIALRLREEETEGRAAPLLVAGTGRLRWAASHLVFVAFAPGLCLVALGLAAGLGYGLASSDLGVVPAMTWSAVEKLPALWVFGAFAVALFGLVPRVAVPISWAVFGIGLLIEMAWETGAVDHTVFALSPFAHVYPGDPVGIGALAGLTAVALVFVGTGLAGLRHRDLS